MILESKISYPYLQTTLYFTVFDHSSCKELSQNIKQALSFRAEFKTQLPENDVHILIFPIMGDDRIPKALEAWINQNAGPKKVFICILGDFDFTNDCTSRTVAQETIKILKTKNKGSVCKTYAVDTPIACYATKAAEFYIELLQFINNPISDALEATCANTPRSLKDNMDMDHPLFKNRNWLNLCEALGNRPIVNQVVGSGTGIALSLTDHNPYPRSLLYNKSNSDLRRIFQYINQIPYIEALKIQFAEMSVWPGHTPKLYDRLIKLDIRGNSFENFSFLNKFKNLKSINVAANNLKILPKGIFYIPSLETIFAYKNSIIYLDPAIGNCLSLRRLSLYRNLLEGVPQEISLCQNLETLNIGANPIKTLPVTFPKLKKLHNLNLRNCKLKTIPSILFQLEHRVNLNVTKNPLLSNIERAHLEASVKFLSVL